MSFFGRIANLVKGSVRVSSQSREGGAREATLDAELRDAEAVAPRRRPARAEPEDAQRAGPSASPVGSPPNEAPPAPERDADGFMKRSL